MAQMRDIPSSVLEHDGSEKKTGVLSLLQKKGIKILKSNDYELNPLYWRLLSYAGQTYLLGYPKQLSAGAKATKKLLVKGCSTEMNLPEKAVVSAHSNETFLCVQCGEKIIFLKAESRSQRNKWVDAIRRACTREPVYHSSTVSTTSTDSSSESFEVLQERDRFARSVHNTADTAPRPGADLRRVVTSPAGQFQISSNRPSVSSIPSSAHALEQQRRRDQEMANAMQLQSQPSTLSTIHSLNSSDRMRYSKSQIDLSPQGIFEDGAQYNGLEYDTGNDPSRLRPLSLSASASVSQPNLQVQDVAPKRLYTKKSQSRYRHSDSGLQVFQQPEGSYAENETLYEESHGPKYEDMPEDNPRLQNPTSDNFYMPLKDYDDQSSVSCVNNLGLENERYANSYFYDDTVAPEVPERDYRLPKDKEKPTQKKSSSKKTRAPQPPKQPIEQMDSIEREKTVCLETRFERENQQPTTKVKSGVVEKSDNMEKEMRGRHGRTPNNTVEAEPFHDYIQRFRSELFQKDGFSVEVPKTDLSQETIKLVCVADCICIAELPNAKLRSLLHVDDVIVKVNRQMLPSIDFCYKLFRTTDENVVQLHVKRVMHGVMSHVTLAANGDIDSLGLEFGNRRQGNEVTAMRSEGLVAKSGSPSRPQAHSVLNGGMLVNWGLVEINQTPVSLDSSPTEVRFQLKQAGCDLALVFVPMDIINVFRERSCEDECK